MKFSFYFKKIEHLKNRFWNEVTHKFTFIVPNSNLSQYHSVAYLLISSRFLDQTGWFHRYQQRFDCSKSSLESFRPNASRYKKFQHLLSWSHVCWLWTQQMLNKWCHTNDLEKRFCENSSKNSKIRLFGTSYFTQQMLPAIQQTIFLKSEKERTKI